MDDKLLEALNNMSVGLEMIAEALNSKKEAQSATAKALQSGNFLEEIKSISQGIEVLKKDNKKILENQETLLGLAKSKKDGKGDVTENLGKDKEKQKHFKEGIGVVLLIAVAVLAIGAAFKLIGNVNFVSVISLAIAMPLIAYAFSKIFTVLKQSGFDSKKDSKNLILAITSIALSFTLASWILSMVVPLTFTKLFTIVLLGVGFTMIVPSVMKIIKSFSKMSFGQLIKSVLFLPLVLPAIALGLAFASWALQLVKPITFSQALSSIFVAAVFAVVAFGIRKMLKSFEGLGPIAIGLAIVALPFVLPAIAKGLAAASLYLSEVKSLSFGQFISTIFVAAVFTVISFGIGKMIKAFQGIEPDALVFAVIAIPLLLPAMAWAIRSSSEYLSEVKDVTFKQFLVAVGVSAVFFALSFSIKKIAKEISQVGLGTIIKLPLIFVTVSLAIMLSSHILAKTKDMTKEKLLKVVAFGVGLGVIMLIFSKSLDKLGRIPMSTLIQGGIAILIVATTIMAASHIIALGRYDKYPSLGWALGVSLSLAAFGLGMTVLGSMIAASFGVGFVALAAGSAAVLMVATTIVTASHILAKGNYKAGPTKAWAEGVAISIGAFSQVYGMLMKNAVLKIFGSGGVGPKEFTTAIITVTKGIVEVAKLFAANAAPFKKGPSKEWSEGVGIAIGAFSPVYSMLMKNKIMSIFGGGVGPKDFVKAILGVADGIIAVAKKFAQNTAPFKSGPSKAWSEGVGSALKAFFPIFKALHQDTGWFTSGGEVINSMIYGITGVSRAIVKSAQIFASGSKYFGAPIDPDFVKKIRNNVLGFAKLTDDLKKYQSTQGPAFLGLDPVSNIARGMLKIANAYDRLANAMRNFSRSLNSMDSLKLVQFRALTANLAVLSALDSRMFSNMMGVLERRAGVFGQLLYKESRTGTGLVQGSRAQTQEMKKPFGKADDSHIRDQRGETQLMKLDKIVRILSAQNKQVDELYKFLQSEAGAPASNEDVGDKEQ